MNARFLQLTGAGNKPEALAALVAAVNAGANPPTTFRTDIRTFSTVPGSTFCYWTPDSVRTAFGRFPRMESDGRLAKRGVNSNDDFRFLRVWWEPASALWVPHAKGGVHAMFYCDVGLSLNWGTDGAELLAERVTDRNYKFAIVPSKHLYFRAGLTWSLRTTKSFSVRVLPQAVVFGSKGPAVVVENDDHVLLLGLTAVLNSRPFMALLEPQLAAADTAARSYEVGVIQSSPIPEPAQLPGRLRDLVHSAWSLKRSLDTLTETSHAFHLPALLQVPGATLAERCATWSGHVTDVEAQLANIQSEIDDIAFGLYGIDGDDRARIEAESGTAPAAATDDEESIAPDAEAAEDGEEEDEDSAADAATLATELVSWAVGVAFGRFDIDYAGGLREPPPEPGPFDPLPARSPGMRPTDDFALELLVDDEGHPDDLPKRVGNVFAHAFGPGHEARLDEAVRLAGASDLRAFLRRQFFPFHLKRYSKSRRKAPIWWPLSTASGGYTAWLAWPHLTRDTLFRVADELKRQKLPFETRRLTSLKQDAGPNPSTREKAAIGAQEDFVSELNALLEEVERVAPLWNPVHDDGVILHFALLWRVVRDAGWQKECRAAWEKLAKGDYDWAHLAMHLWPERVAPKCRTDRSLAIAHGLEDTFWVEVSGKWQARPNTDAALAAAIAERSSPAVKAALRALESAPVPSRGGRGRRGG